MSGSEAPRTLAFAGGDLGSEQPDVQHFGMLSDAAEFMNAKDGGLARAVGFFSARLDAPEHTLFLTVAKRVADKAHPLAVKLGRATVGRGTKGATVYLVPRASAVAPNGSSVEAALLTYQYRLPESPRDEWLPERWKELRLAASPPAPFPPSAPAMWEEVLEAEATSLDRFMRRGALPNAVELSTDTAATLTSNAHTVGLMLLPQKGLGASMQNYHLRRLARLATVFAPLSCGALDAEQAEREAKPWASWLSHAECVAQPAANATRFAHAIATPPLAALLGARYGLVIPDLWPPKTRGAEVRFALLRRRTGTRASVGDEDEMGRWRVHMHRGDVTVDAMASFVRKHQGASAEEEEEEERPSTETETERDEL